MLSNVGGLEKKNRGEGGHRREVQNFCNFVCFEILGISYRSRLDWGSYIVSITKTAYKKIGALISSMKFLTLYLYESTIRTCLEYCCYVWADAPSCYLDWIC